MGCGVCGEKVKPVQAGLDACRGCHILEEVFFGAPGSVELPEGIHVERPTDDALMVSRSLRKAEDVRRFSRTLVHTSAILLIALALAFVLFERAIGVDRRQALLLLAGVYALVMIPWPLLRLTALLRNRDRIRATPEGLTLSRGPVSLERPIHIQRQRIQRVVCRCLPEKDAECAYQVDALLDDGEMILLIDRLETLNQARFIQHELGAKLS